MLNYNKAAAQNTKEILQQFLSEYSTKFQTLTDSQRADYLNNIAYYYLAINVDSAFHYCDAAIKMASKADAQELLSDAFLNKGVTSIWAGHYTEAQKNLAEAAKLAEKSNNSSVLLNVYRMYVYMYHLNGMWDKAWIYSKRMEDYSKAIQQNPDYQDGDVLSNYAVIYSGLGEYTKGDSYFEKALVAYQVDSLYDLQANVQMDYAMSLIKQKKFDAARVNLEKSYAFYTKAEEPVQLADLNERYALYFIEKRDYDSALVYLQQSLAFYLENTMDVDEHRCRLYMARAYAGKKNYQKTITEASLANDYFKKRTEKHFRLQALELLCEADKALGVEKNAFRYLDDYITTQHELTAQKSEMRALELIAEFELEQKQNENDLLKNQYDAQRQRLTILVISGISMLLFAILLFVLYRQKNKVLEHVKLLQETGEQKNIELEKINGIKDKLISMIAHDIRSPLASVQNTLTLTQDKTLSQNEFQQLGKVLEGEIHHLRGMLDNLLLWARQQVTEIKVNKTSFNLYELISETLSLYEKNIEHKELIIHNTVNSEIIVFTDRDIIQTVFRNILSNAIKFTKNGKYIDIALTEEKGNLLLRVIDKGQGISPENLEKIAKNEYLSTRGTSNEKGTGLGLLFSKELLQKLGEKLSIESESGKGTTASISISK